MEITASGYENLTFDVVNGQPEITLTEAPVISGITLEGGVMGQYNRVAFEGDVTDYLPAITSITLNGQEAKLVTNLFNETKAYQFSNDPAYGGADKFIDFTTDCFAGLVEVVVKADGYEDLTFTVVDGSLLKAVPGFQNFKFQEDMLRGDHYRLSFNTVDAVTSATGGNGGGGVDPIVPPLPEPTPEMKELYNYVSSLKTYQNEMKDSSITIDGVEVEESTNATLNDSNSFLVIADEHDMSRNAVVFNLDCFDNKENAEVVIKVAGYEDLVMTVSGRKVEVKPDPQPDPEKPQGDLAAPVVADIQHKLSAFSGNSFVIKMANPETVTDNQYVYTFLRNLTKVTVNDVVFTEAASFGSLLDNQYRLNASSGELVLSENALGKGAGEFTVVLESTGYQTMTFRVVDGQLAPMEPQLPAAPAVSTITAKSSFSGNYYIVAFEGGEEVAAPFVEAITAVSVNGQEVKRVTSFFNDTMSYKTSNDPAYGGAYQFVDFTADCFAGEKTVVIEAEGFAPLTFQVVDGALVK